MLKSIGCSSRGPRFNFQHPHGGSQLPVTQVPVDSTLPYRHAGKAAMYIKIKKFFEKTLIQKNLLVLQSIIEIMLLPSAQGAIPF